MKLEAKTYDMVMDIKEKYNGLFLVDFSYQLHRFFYAHSMLSINRGGVELPTGHIYGVLRLVASMRKDAPDYAVVLVLDGKDPEKKELNEDYKAGREKKKYNVYSDVTKILEMVSLIEEGVYVSYDESKEADDTIFAIAKCFEKCWEGEEKEILISSSDKDFYQAVSEKIKIVKSFGKKGFLESADVIDEGRVREEFYGVNPRDLVKLRAIIGDSSDNIKGFIRFPRKLAAKMANGGVKFYENTLDVVNKKSFTSSELNNIDKVKKEYDRFMNNYKLMKLKVYPFKLRVPESNRAMELVNEYRMNSFKKEVETINGRQL